MVNPLDHPILTFMLFMLHAYCFWGGCFQGRALAAARQKRTVSFYRDEAEMSAAASVWVFFFLLVLPWTELIQERGFPGERFLVHSYLIPFAIGILTGLEASRWFYKSYIKVVLATFLVAALTALITGNIPLNALAGYNLALVVCLFAITAVMATNLKLFNDVGRTRSDKQITSLSDLATSPETRTSLELISHDGKLIPNPMRYNLIELFPASLSADAPEFHVYVDAESDTTFAMLYLRVSTDPENSAPSEIPDTRSVANAAWFHIPWENVTHLEVKKVDGTRVTSFSLRNSGSTILLKGAPQPLRRYCRLKSTLPLHEARPA